MKEIRIGVVHVVTASLRKIKSNVQNKVLLHLHKLGCISERARRKPTKEDNEGSRFAIFYDPINFYKRSTFAYAHIGNGLFAITQAITHDDDQFARKVGRMKAMAKLRGLLGKKNNTWFHMDNLPSWIPEKVCRAMKFQYKLETQQKKEFTEKK